MLVKSCPILKTQSSLVFISKNLNKMKDFLLVFRMDYSTMPKGSPEEMQARTKRYMETLCICEQTACSCIK